jgi:hypothetical protein
MPKISAKKSIAKKSVAKKSVAKNPETSPSYMPLQRVRVDAEVDPDLPPFGCVKVTEEKKKAVADMWGVLEVNYGRAWPVEFDVWPHYAPDESIKYVAYFCDETDCCYITPLATMENKKEEELNRIKLELPEKEVQLITWDKFMWLHEALFNLM